MHHIIENKQVTALVMSVIFVLSKHSILPRLYDDNENICLAGLFAYNVLCVHSFQSSLTSNLRSRFVCLYNKFKENQVFELFCAYRLCSLHLPQQPCHHHHCWRIMKWFCVILEHTQRSVPVLSVLERRSTSGRAIFQSVKEDDDGDDELLCT